MLVILWKHELNLFAIFVIFTCTLHMVFCSNEKYIEKGKISNEIS